MSASAHSERALTTVSLYTGNTDYAQVQRRLDDFLETFLDGKQRVEFFKDLLDVTEACLSGSSLTFALCPWEEGREVSDLDVQVPEGKTAIWGSWLRSIGQKETTHVESSAYCELEWISAVTTQMRSERDPTAGVIQIVHMKPSMTRENVPLHVDLSICASAYQDRLFQTLEPDLTRAGVAQPMPWAREDPLGGIKLGVRKMKYRARGFTILETPPRFGIDAAPEPVVGELAEEADEVAIHEPEPEVIEVASGDEDDDESDVSSYVDDTDTDTGSDSEDELVTDAAASGAEKSRWVRGDEPEVVDFEKTAIAREFVEEKPVYPDYLAARMSTLSASLAKTAVAMDNEKMTRILQIASETRELIDKKDPVYDLDVRGAILALREDTPAHKNEPLLAVIMKNLEETATDRRYACDATCMRPYQ